jgi:hypothetical protein
LLAAASDDFAALAGWSATWVLAVDADHRVSADPVALRRLLSGATENVLLIEVEDEHHAGLRDGGAGPAYCDWLAAQALAQLGDPHEAAVLLAGVTEVVDTAGRHRDPTALWELAALVDRLGSLAPAGPANETWA